MQGILRYVIPALCLLVFGVRPSGAETAPALTQRDWMINLVEAAGLSYGLPDAPEDADYLRLLQGNRTLRVEAEETHQPEDMVSAEEFRTFGPYSGKGWLSGISTPTTARLRFLLPLGGTYRLSASLRRSGHSIRIAGQTLTGDGGESFSRADLGEVALSAGPQEIELALPPGGAVDFVELAAPPLPSVEPLGGWKLDQPLSLDVMAETTARLLNLHPLLPPSGETVRVEAESALSAGTADISKAVHLGQPSGGRWVRTGGEPTEVEIVFTPPAPGVYDLTLQGAAEGPVMARVNGGAEVPLSFAPYLQPAPLGTFVLPAGASRLRVQLPPRGGIDVLLLQRRQGSPAAYRRLVGLPATGEVPAETEVNALLSLLASLGPGI